LKEGQDSSTDSTDEDAEDSAFGAKSVMVILVRDEEMRATIQPEVGDSALVLTILESKGMEFENVFLYNFFATTPHGSDYQILEPPLVEYYSASKCDSTILFFGADNLEREQRAQICWREERP
jgi:superfamily I DNA/RNA helicase